MGLGLGGMAVFSTCKRMSVSIFPGAQTVAGQWQGWAKPAPRAAGQLALLLILSPRATLGVRSGHCGKAPLEPAGPLAPEVWLTAPQGLFILQDVTAPSWLPGCCCRTQSLSFQPSWVPRKPRFGVSLCTEVRTFEASECVHMQLSEKGWEALAPESTLGNQRNSCFLLCTQGCSFPLES